MAFDSCPEIDASVGQDVSYLPLISYMFISERKAQLTRQTLNYIVAETGRSVILLIFPRNYGHLGICSSRSLCLTMCGCIGP